MKTLSLALYAEGTTDYRFLAIVIQSAVEKILFEHQCPDIAVVEPTLIMDVEGHTESDKIFSAAQNAQGAHLLFVHLDADTRTVERAKAERFYPGQNRVVSSNDSVCKDLVPVVPVKNIEAWLVSDYEAFCKVVGTKASERELGLPSHPRLVESLPDPKRTFREALRIAHSMRRKRSNYHPGEYYELLARTIKMESLLKVPAFKIFYDELTEMLWRQRLFG
jgi:hypothetical protein